MKQNVINKISNDTNFFSDVPKAELRRLLKCARTLNLKKDEYFLRADEIPKRIGFIISGLLRLFYLDNSGKDVTKHFCPEHTLAISYSAFIQKEPSRLYIHALEDTKLITIDYNTYIDLLNSHICWQITARKLAEMVFILKEKREAEFLLDDAQSRYSQFLKDYPALINRVKQYYIASYLGITKEFLSISSFTFL